LLQEGRPSEIEEAMTLMASSTLLGVSTPVWMFVQFIREEKRWREKREGETALQMDRCRRDRRKRGTDCVFFYNVGRRQSHSKGKE
jgi:hypothetical protein